MSGRTSTTVAWSKRGGMVSACVAIWWKSDMLGGSLKVLVLALALRLMARSHFRLVTKDSVEG
jgi:hypothetical protein